jgi:tetratricopeptide (TPR) repeat protein
MDETLPSNETRTEFYVRETIAWIRDHREQFWTAIGIVIFAVAGVLFFIQKQKTQSDAAWMSLAQSQGLLMQGKPDDALKAVDEWLATNNGSDAASYGKFIRAEALQKSGKTVDSIAVYTDLASSASPKDMRPLALSGLASSAESAGDFALARSTSQEFLSKYPDHFLAGSMYLVQARSNESLGDKAAAASLYERFNILYPQSPYTEAVKLKQQALGGAPQP